MKKILFIFHQKNFDGGASRSIIDVIEKLKKQNEYKIYALIPSMGDIAKYLKKIEVEYFIGNYKLSMTAKNNIWYLKKLVYPIFNIIGFYKANQFFKDKKIDLIYTNTSVIDIGFELSKKYNCKHICHIREFGKEDLSLEYIYSKNKRKKYYNDKNTKIITISESLKKKYEELTGRKDISLIYNGIKDNFLKKEYTKNKNINFLLIGTIFKGKNQLEALKAIKVLLEKGISNFKLVFVGPESKNYKKSLEEYIKKNNLEKMVSFLGSKNNEEIKEIIKNSDVGLMLSLNEAFGRVTVEYMFGELPVIASNTGANPELIIEGENGYLYELGDVDDLSQKMCIFIENPDLIKKIGKKAREIAKRKYTSEINFIEIKKIIEEQLRD